MATAEPTLSRARGRAVTALTFERAALITLGLLWLVVVTGGLVRLTAAHRRTHNEIIARPWSSFRIGTARIENGLLFGRS